MLRVLVVEVVLDAKLLGYAKEAVDLASVRRRAVAEPLVGGGKRRVADVVPVPVREDGVVDRLFRIHTMDIARHPLAAETVGRGQQRNLVTIARTKEVARVVKDGRAVGETVEHVLAAARIDEMEIHLARLPARVWLANLVGCATSNAGCRKRAKRGCVLEKIASIQYKHDLFLSNA